MYVRTIRYQFNATSHSQVLHSLVRAVTLASASDSRVRVQTLASTSNSNVPLASTKQNYTKIWQTLFINSSTSCCYFNISFMRWIFSRCHAHFIYYSTLYEYFNTSSIYLVGATPIILTVVLRLQGRSQTLRDGRAHQFL